MLDDRTQQIWLDAIELFKVDFPENVPAMRAVVDLAKIAFEAQVARVIDPTDPRYEEWARDEARLALCMTTVDWVKGNARRRANRNVRML
jgi:hypothetical protein